MRRNQRIYLLLGSLLAAALIASGVTMARRPDSPRASLSHPIASSSARTALAPHLARGAHDELQLAPLLFLREQVARGDRGEATLRAQS